MNNFILGLPILNPVIHVAVKIKILIILRHYDNNSYLNINLFTSKRPQAKTFRKLFNILNV
jgi:hypothetical protein